MCPLAPPTTARPSSAARPPLIRRSSVPPRSTPPPPPPGTAHPPLAAHAARPRRSPAARGSYSRSSSAARSLDHLLLYPSLRLCHSLPCSARPGVGFCRNLVSCCSYGKAAEGFWRHMTDGKIYSCCNRLDRSNASRLLYAVPRDRNRPIRQEVLVSRVESRRRGLTLSGSLKES